MANKQISLVTIILKIKLKLRFKIKKQLQVPMILLLIVLAVLTSCQVVYPKNTVYNVEFSKKMAVYSSLAYCDNNCQVGWKCLSARNYSPLQNVVIFQSKRDDLKGYVGYSPNQNTNFIIFRGTNGWKSMENWQRNVQFVSYKYMVCPQCEVHTGFLKNYRALYLSLKQLFQQKFKKNPSASVVVTGHSMGGAVATIAALQLKLKYGVRVELHTFGSPRVGNAAYSNYVNKNLDKIYRVVHDSDMFVHFPPKNSGYKHTGNSILWNRQFTSYKMCMDGEDKSCTKDLDTYSKQNHGLYFMQISSPKC